MIDNSGEPLDSTPTGSIPWDSSWPESVGRAERHALLNSLEGRFGIPSALFEDYLLFKRKQSWWLLRKTPVIQFAAHLKVSQVGLRAFQRVGSFIKPTTRMIQVFGHLAHRARVELGEKALENLLDGIPFPFDMEIENGYVILFFKGHPLGLGLLIDGWVRLQMSKNGLRLPARQKSFTHPLMPANI